MTVQWLKNNMNMIGHDDPGKQAIADPIKMSECFGDDFGNSGIFQIVGTSVMSTVIQFFKMKFLKFIEFPLSGISLAFFKALENVPASEFSVSLEKRRQRTSESEGYKIDRVLDSPVRQIGSLGFLDFRHSRLW